MITVNDIVSKMVSALDAEGSSRYSFDRDFMPAINYSIEYYISVFNFAFGNKKLSEENLREITRTRIWQTSNTSRIYLNPADIGSEVWTIIRISPEPIVQPVTEPVVNPNPENSLFTEDVVFVSSEYSASRLTLEEWNENSKNIFMPGNVTLINSFKEYSYRNAVQTKSGNLPNEITQEIEIRPFLDNQLVAVTYMSYPVPITSEQDTILFPKTMMNLLINKALYFISMKQGDGTNLYGIVDKEISVLVGLMS